MNQEKGRPVLAIDIGGSKVMAGIVDGSGKIETWEREILERDYELDEVIECILKLTTRLRKRDEWRDVARVGVAIPGLADPERGLWVYSPFSGIREAPIRSILSKALQLPVAIENDVNACAYAERRYGVCGDVESFIWVTVSNGVGGGLVLGGEIYRGAFLNSGEIGHINVVEGGRLCGCGNRGCLEAYASGASIARRYGELIHHREKHTPDIDAKGIGKRARDGDEIALRIYEETGYYLGKAISYAVNLINPEKVILGGGVSTDLDLFLPKLEETLRDLVFSEANTGLRIEQTAFLHNAGLIGAAAIAQR